MILLIPFRVAPLGCFQFVNNIDDSCLFLVVKRGDGGFNGEIKIGSANMTNVKVGIFELTSLLRKGDLFFWIVPTVCPRSGFL